MGQKREELDCLSVPIEHGARRSCRAQELSCTYLVPSPLSRFPLRASYSPVANRAWEIFAPCSELGKEDYCACRDFILGSRGLLWKLVLSTNGHRSFAESRPAFLQSSVRARQSSRSAAVFK